MISAQCDDNAPCGKWRSVTPLGQFRAAVTNTQSRRLCCDWGVWLQSRTARKSQNTNCWYYYYYNAWSCKLRLPYLVLWRRLSTRFDLNQHSKIIRTITNAPRYVTNHTLHTDLNVPYVSEVINERINKHLNKSEFHPNPLLETLTQPMSNRRLKRRWTSDLQDWGDIAGWPPFLDTITRQQIRL